MKTRRTFHRSALATAALIALAPAAFATDYTWTGGSYPSDATWPNPLGVGDTLYITTGSAKYIDGALINDGTISASDDLYFRNGNTLTNNGLFVWTTDSSFVDGGYNGSFINSGTLRKSGGTGTSYVGITGFQNSGTIDVQTGTINFNAGGIFNAGSSFTGAGTALISNGATFNGALSSQNLVLGAGTFTGNAAQVNGSVSWSSGYLQGSWEVAAGQTLSTTTGGGKYINAAVANNGSFKLGDDLYFANGNVVTNAGTMSLQGDVGLYDGGYNGGVNNTGTFRKTAGTGTSYVSITGFQNSGTIEAQSGTINFNAGVAINDGSKFAGAGQVVISSGGSFSGTYQTAGNLSLTGGTYTGTGAKIDGDTRWVAGVMSGDWQLLAGRTLTLDTGGSKYMNASITNAGTVLANDDLYFTNGNTLTNQGTYKLNGDVGLYDGGYNGSFINNGTFVKTAGASTSYVSISGFQNNGTIRADSGTINFNTGATFNDGSQFTGAGQIFVTGNSTFNGGFATAGQLTLASAAFNGNAAQLNGSATWQSGMLTGTWAVGSASTLALTGGGTKYLNASLVNNGTIVATDDLYFQNGNTLTNQSSYQLGGDVSLYDGGYQGSFVNNGTFEKTSGSSTSYVSINGFQNNGTIRADSGTINFNYGALFNAGSVFDGGGKVVVSNGATFVGGFSTGGQLNLAGGNLAGGNGTAGSSGTLAAGSATWSGGSLVGNWQLASGTTLNISSGSGKYVNGAVANSGRVVATDDIYLQNGNTVTNAGVYEAKADVGIYDGGYNGHFVNTGTFVKTGGTGTTNVSSVDFQNAGTVDVQTGTIQLPANFSNAGVLTGAGAFTTNVLSNSGHVAAGDGAGTLTLNGNFVQTAAGTLDTQLASTSLFDTLLVNGTASLDGTLALSCIGSCAVHTGDTFVILDATGDLTGTFANVTASGFGAGFQYSVVYDRADDLVKLDVLDAGVLPVPEPGSWALMAGGLGMLGLLARRRRVASAASVS